MRWFQRLLQGVCEESDRQKELLEIYKMTVEMADRVSQRRQSANSFYLSINTAIVGGAAFLQSKSAQWFPTLTVAAAGILVCFLWRQAIESYRNLNRAKFEVIHRIEMKLIARPYSEEWKVIDPVGIHRKHRAFYQTERIVPQVFMFVYLLDIVLQTPWADAWSWVACRLH